MPLAPVPLARPGQTARRARSHTIRAQCPSRASFHARRLTLSRATERPGGTLSTRLQTCAPN
eukprot:1856144-Pleurochrysis_carterae.AAC.1